MSPRQRAELPWLKDWASSFSALYDDYEHLVTADPMIQYRPKHSVSEAFHKSSAFIRYFMAGNGTSKTQTGYAEDYRVVTRTDPHRKYPDWAASVAIVGLGFTKYAPNVFEAKFLNGENGNILSPMFPEGGRWFHSYDKKTRKIWLACPECANSWKASECGHQKSSITLFSDEGDWEIFQGATYQVVHFDEHIEEERFFAEAQQRVIRIKGGRLYITGTPLFGPTAWEVTRVLSIATGAPEKNRIDESDPASPKLAEVFEISQYDAGIVPKENIEMSKKTMDEFEIEARIYGRPVPLSKSPVFDRTILAKMREGCRTPTYGNIHCALKSPDQGILYSLEEIISPGDVTFTEEKVHDVKGFTGLRIWEFPQPGASYIIPADSAAGLSPKTGDASCAPVLKLLVHPDGTVGLEQVAQFHGWINPIAYADEVKKLGVFYNLAMVVPEYTGIGRALMLRLSKQLFYPNLFRDTRMPEYAEFGQAERLGVDTNISTKPIFVATLQQMLRQGLIKLYCLETVKELLAFDQERTESGLQTRYRGGGGMHDDRVMALCFGAYVSQHHIHLFNQLAGSPQASVLTGNQITESMTRGNNPFRTY